MGCFLVHQLKSSNNSQKPGLDASLDDALKDQYHNAVPMHDHLGTRSPTSVADLSERTTKSTCLGSRSQARLVTPQLAL